MRADVLHGVPRLEAEWWDLWSRDPRATVFQSPAWLIPWREAFDEGESLVLAVRDGERLMALLPLFRHEGRLIPWGAGTTDRLDGIFDPTLDPATLAQALDRLSEPVELFQVEENSLLRRIPLPEGWEERSGTAEPCLELPLPAALSRNMAQNLRYYRRRAERAGVAEPERGGPAAFEDLVDLHGRRWQSRGLPGVLQDPRVLAWHRRALPALDAAGLLRLYVLRQGGRAVAVLYGLMAKDRAFYYLGGFDPELESLGLGTVLIGHAVEEAQREGATVFDFLRGREAYKYRWGAGERTMYARRLAPVSCVAARLAAPSLRNGESAQ